jgi:hypothetical protein
VRAVFILLLLVPSLVGAQNTNAWYEVDGGRWNVDPSIVQEAVPLLQLAANKESERREVTAPDLQSYVIQYQGVVVKLKDAAQEDTRSVLIRGACEIPEDVIPSLSGTWYLKSDGSECYFGAFYDPTSKRLTVFSFE